MCDREIKLNGAAEKSLLFFTCANRKYEDFIPLYSFFALLTQPTAAMEFGVEDPELFLKENGKVIGFIEDNFGPKRIHIRGARWRDGRNRLIVPNSVRFLETPETTSDYVYLGDVDIIILDKNISDIHLKFMKKTGLSYSNSLRPNTDRMTGLHFTRFDRHYPLPDLSGISTDNDERLLCEIVRRQGMPLQDQVWFRPIHGIHISPNRVPFPERDETGKELRPGWGIEWYREAWKSVRIDPAFCMLRPMLSLRIQDCLAKIDGVADGLLKDQ